MKALSAMALLVSIIGTTVVSAATFDGNQCLGDCSGHQAGYDWAEQNGVDDESSCTTPSESFNEGCQSYIEESSGAISSSDDDDDDEDDE